MKTIKDLAKEALLVQDACNLSGIVHSFSRAMTQLREIEPNQDTLFYNNHPIAILYSDKITQLTDSEHSFSKAYDQCKTLAGEMA